MNVLAFLFLMWLATQPFTPIEKLPSMCETQDIEWGRWNCESPS